MRDLITFREPLRKRQIMELAYTDVNNMLESGKTDPLETHVFFKRLKLYVDEFIKNNETNAIDVFNQRKDHPTISGSDVSFTQGGPILDYEKDLEYKQLSEQLKKRKEYLDLSFKLTCAATWGKYF